MKCSRLKRGLLLTVLLVVTGCSEPPAPTEIQLALAQETELWRAGASIYTPESYQQYLSALNSARDLYTRERSRMVWFRDYQPVAQSFAQVHAMGEKMQGEVQSVALQQSTEITQTADALEKRIILLKELSGTLKDRRLAMRKLTQADIRIEDARRLAKERRSKEANEKLEAARIDIDAVIKTIRPLLERFADRQQIARWKAQVDQALAESRREGKDLIIVRKVDRQLTLYRKGGRVRDFNAGFGFNFLADKLYSGDKATPEGEYKIVKKLPYSRFYKALLIDYPNQEDQQRFALAKKKKLIPANVGIGNLIEIHGGGDDSMTNGCISLQDHHITDLFDQVDVGTPVLIVGTIDYDNIIASALRGLN
ncbi:MAG: L,D-transpeptidase family protein [Desulfuromonadales bacterium]|nr:L,D-transpeptidase family protein [Desulfuromonadales bacterium]